MSNYINNDREERQFYEPIYQTGFLTRSLFLCCPSCTRTHVRFFCFICIGSERRFKLWNFRDLFMNHSIKLFDSFVFCGCVKANWFVSLPEEKNITISKLLIFFKNVNCCFIYFWCERASVWMFHSRWLSGWNWSLADLSFWITCKFCSRPPGEDTYVYYSFNRVFIQWTEKSHWSPLFLKVFYGLLSGTTEKAFSL